MISVLKIITQETRLARDMLEAALNIVNPPASFQSSSEAPKRQKLREGFIEAKLVSDELKSDIICAYAMVLTQAKQFDAATKVLSADLPSSATVAMSEVLHLIRVGDLMGAIELWLEKRASTVADPPALSHERFAHGKKKSPDISHAKQNLLSALSLHFWDSSY
jgi:hypothetical protein